MNSPVPSNVIAKEIDEIPLIKINTANGDRRPILENSTLFISFKFIQFLFTCKQQLEQ